ncbi:MAG: carbohydrate-binding domain-containing protein [Pseudomonadota bacterium]|nr:carbohydrate-binding domain-containing protein [Pseudomonadota bacterium]
MWFQLHRFLLLTLLAVGLAACGGSGDDGDAGTGSAPVITAQPQSVSIASGATATLSVAATGSGTLSYQWHLDGNAISGATAASHTTGIAGSYTVVVSNEVGSVTSEAAIVTVHAEASWNIATGAHAPDLIDTSGYLPLSIALDSLSISSTSPRLTVSSTSAHEIVVALDGAAAITITRDSHGATVRSTLSGGTHIAYQLSGSGNTPLTVYSANAYKLVLTDASITSSDGPALNLQSAQTAFIELAGSNSLADSATYSSRTGDDGSGMDLKAALFAEGPLVISGSGRLRVAGTPRHALASDAHVRLRSGTVTLSAAARDGLRAKHAFVMDGGTLDITAKAGKGIKVDGQESTTAQALGFVAINDGHLNITSHDKAITAAWEGDEDGDTPTTADDPDPRVTINGGTLTITTTGAPREDTNPADGDDSLAPEGVEAKSVLTINGGTLDIRTTEDALNAGTGIAINGGRVYAVSSVGDGIDANGALSISGGYIVTRGAFSPESGLDVSDAFTLSGGVLVALAPGGSNSKPQATQNTLFTNDGLSPGLWTLRDAAGNAVFAFEVPHSVAAMLLSAPQIATGATYSVVHGGTVASQDEIFYGLHINPTTHSGGTVKGAVSIASTLTAF